MKPLYLKMTSFGPFINEEIDFSVILNKGIFLISGDTGSGKTTIFDGISVALFGESSGDERSAASFRSDYEHATEMVRIEFVFEINGEVYKIIRTPKQMRKKLKGEGITEYAGDVSLYQKIDNEFQGIAYEKDVSEKIGEIIGVEAKQFRQLVMIPQGQFRKLITEKSDEREKVLKKLFDVERYQQFQRKLEQKAAAGTKELDEIRHSIQIEMEHLSLPSLPENASVREVLAALQEQTELELEERQHLIQYEDELRVTLKDGTNSLNEARRNNHLLADYQEVIKQEVELSKEKEEMDKRMKTLILSEAALRIIPLESNMLNRREAYNHQRLLVEQMEVDLKRLQEEYHKAHMELSDYEKSEAFTSLQGFKEEIFRLRSIEPKVKQYQALTDESSHMALKARELEKDLKVCHNHLEAIKTELNRLENEKEQKKEAPLTLQKRETELQNDRNLYKQLDRLEKSIQAEKELRLKEKEAEEKVEQVRNNRAKQQKELDILKEKFILDQAAYIAQSLQEGEPCPVCGSLHHPKPSEGIHGVIHKNELQTAETKLAELDQEVRRLEDEYRKDKMNLELEIAKTRDGASQLGMDPDDCHRLKEKLIHKNEQAGEEIKRLMVSVEELKTVEEKIIDKKGSLTVCEDALEEKKNLLQTVKDELLKQQTLWRSLEEEISQEYRDERRLHSRMEELERILLTIENTAIQLKTSFEEKSDSYKALSTRLEENKKVLQEKETASIDAKRAFESAFLSNSFKDHSEYYAVKRTIEEVQRERELIEEYDRKCSFMIKKIEELSERVKGLEWQDVQNLEMSISELQLTLETTQRNRTLLELKIQENRRQGSKIEAYHQDLLEKTEEYSTLQELSLLANGKGKLRVTLERYILATFLEEIVKAANLRLYPMTNGRYQMLRRGQTTDHRKNTGLDLEIFDYHTGKARDITTLSGGESFKASLSLALGLSDIACSYAGGINLDTMFIDEGFGSLSSEDLDLAVDCLMDLSNVGRLVGIISHVTELKDRIEPKLLVEKTRLGSFTRFVV